MNVLSRVLDALRHPHEFPEQRRRRRMLATLAESEHLARLLSPTMPQPVVRAGRIANACRCEHLREEHLSPAVRGVLVESDMVCTACPCLRYTPARVVVMEPR